METTIEPRPIEGLIGWREAHLAEVGSTNETLFKYAKQGSDTNQLWLTAGQQNNGKGRRGRNWLSPVGNFHGSLYLQDPCDAEALGFLPLVCAVAMHGAIADVLVGHKHQVQIKWPNDILINGAKISGMLVEAGHQANHLEVVIGCGINLIAHPSDTPYPATNLNELGVRVSPSQMLHHLATRFADFLKLWDRGKGNDAVLGIWTEHARGIGEKMIVNLADRQLEGLFEGVDENGVLLLREPSGQLSEISAGDIFYPHMTK